ncbi:hypothetical protein [Kocuria atrinae]|nr:hypothetical protein [Kocuria atrinae]
MTTEQNRPASDQPAETASVSTAVADVIAERSDTCSASWATAMPT